MPAAGRLPPARSRARPRRQTARRPARRNARAGAPAATRTTTSLSSTTALFRRSSSDSVSGCRTGSPRTAAHRRSAARRVRYRRAPAVPRSTTVTRSGSVGESTKLNWLSAASASSAMLTVPRMLRGVTVNGSKVTACRAARVQRGRLAADRDAVHRQRDGLARRAGVAAIDQACRDRHALLVGERRARERHAGDARRSAGRRAPDHRHRRQQRRPAGSRAPSSPRQPVRWKSLMRIDLAARQLRLGQDAARDFQRRARSAWRRRPAWRSRRPPSASRAPAVERIRMSAPEEKSTIEPRSDGVSLPIASSRRRARLLPPIAVAHAVAGVEQHHELRARPARAARRVGALRAAAARTPG